MLLRARLEAKGVQVVDDLCTKVEHARLLRRVRSVDWVRPNLTARMCMTERMVAKSG